MPTALPKDSAARWKRVLLVVLEALLIAAILYSIYWWRNRDLLPADSAAVPAFELISLDGAAWTEESLDDGTTVLYFFAPWCTVCKASAHQLRWFQRWSPGESEVVMVALDWTSTSQVREYVADRRIEAPVLLGDARTAAAFRVSGYPTYYVIRNGRVMRRDFGYTTLVGLWWRTRIGTT